jgi:hypothetical protein
MKYNKLLTRLYLLLLLVCLLAGCTKYTISEDIHEEIKAPIYEISRDRLNDMENITVLELLVLLKYQVPIPKIGTEYNMVLRRIKQSEAKIYKKQDSLIVVELFKKHPDTKKLISIMRLEYHFENQQLIKGPIIVK